ncbi:MAG: hypothetical protein ACI9W5_000385, partial [Ulvibacter sp.]
LSQETLTLLFFNNKADPILIIIFFFFRIFIYPKGKFWHNTVSNL